MMLMPLERGMIQVLPRVPERAWQQRAMVQGVGDIAHSDPWLCGELLRGGVLGQLVSVLHRMRDPDRGVTPADDTARADIPSYAMAISQLLPCFAAAPEVWAAQSHVRLLQAFSACANRSWFMHQTLAAAWICDAGQLLRVRNAALQVFWAALRMVQVTGTCPALTGWPGRAGIRGCLHV